MFTKKKCAKIFGITIVNKFGLLIPNTKQGNLTRICVFGRAAIFILIPHTLTTFHAAATTRVCLSYYYVLCINWMTFCQLLPPVVDLGDSNIHLSWKAVFSLRANILVELFQKYTKSCASTLDCLRLNADQMLPKKRRNFSDSIRSIRSSIT